MDAEGAQPPPDVVIAWFGARQHGLVACRQLLAAGVGRGAIAHRVRTGRLIPVHRGVYAVGHLHRSSAVRWMAAVLACGDGALLSHAAADEITTHREIPVTSVARTLLDVASGLQPHALGRAIERSEIRGLFDLAAVDRTLELHRSHAGARKLVHAVAAFRDDEITRSDLEAIFLALCDAHHLPRPLVNHIVEGVEVDFLWPAGRLVAEADGRTTHLTRAAFERDRAKDAKLTVAGCRVVRFTYRQILHDPRTVVQTLSALLASQPERSISSTR